MIERVHYCHIIAHRIDGLTHPPGGPDAQIVSKLGPNAMTAWLTDDVDRYCLYVDRANALTGVMMKMTFQGLRITRLPVEVRRRVSELRADRRRRLGNAEALVVRFEGESEVEMDRVHSERGVRYGFDLIGKRELAEEHKKELNAVIGALCVASNRVLDMHEVANAVYLEDEDGLPIYSISFSVTGSASVAMETSPEIADASERVFSAMAKHPKLVGTVRLLVDAAKSREDRLRAFLAGWTALEALASYRFREHETRLLKQAFSVGSSPARTAYGKRLSAIMGGKHNVRDRFILMLCELSANEREELADLTTFDEAKAARDRLVHRLTFDEQSLPTAAIRELVTRYLHRHLSS